MTDFLKIVNTTRGDLTLPTGETIPALGTSEVPAAHLDATTHPVLAAWLTEGRLALYEPPAPEAEEGPAPGAVDDPAPAPAAPEAKAAKKG